MGQDNRKTVTEQMHGIPERLMEQELTAELVDKPKPVCAKPHRELKSGEPCKDCGFRKL